MLYQDAEVNARWCRQKTEALPGVSVFAFTEDSPSAAAAWGRWASWRFFFLYKPPKGGRGVKGGGGGRSSLYGLSWRSGGAKCPAALVLPWTGRLLVVPAHFV